MLFTQISALYVCTFALWIHTVALPEVTYKTVFYATACVIVLSVMHWEFRKLAPWIHGSQKHHPHYRIGVQYLLVMIIPK